MLDLFFLLYLAHSSLEDQEFLRIAKDAESLLISHCLENLLSCLPLFHLSLSSFRFHSYLLFYALLNYLAVGILLLMLIINQRPPRRSD